MEPSFEVILEDFLRKQISEKPMNEGLLKSVLIKVEEWLSQKKNSAFAFAKVLKLYDPNMKPEEQGDMDDTFRTACFFVISKFAIELDLAKTLVASEHPVNIPHSEKMCDAVFAASHYIDFKGGRNYEKYIESFGYAVCKKQVCKFIEKSSIAIIKLMDEQGHEIFTDYPKLINFF